MTNGLRSFGSMSFWDQATVSQAVRAVQAQARTDRYQKMMTVNEQQEAVMETIDEDE